MLNDRKKVIAAGHICLDITPVFSPEQTVYINDILVPGKLTSIGEADIHTGGSAANTGLAMKFFGADVSIVGKTGNDQFGKLIADILKKHGASDGLIVSDGESTSYTIVLAPPGVDRIFLHNPGANDRFFADDISVDTLKDAALFHFGYPPIMRSIYQNDGAELIKLLKKAKENDTATSLDMAAVDPQSEAGRTDWARLLRDVLPYVDFFLPSAEELVFMLDRPRFDKWMQETDKKELTSILSIDDDIKPLADRLLGMGAKIVLIKCGALGIYYRTASKSVLESISFPADLSSWADREGFEKSYEPEKVLSATGAGDTCIAAFLTAALRGYSLDRCLRLAAAAGASCVEAYDALSGLKSFGELEKKIETGWKKRQ